MDVYTTAFIPFPTGYTTFIIQFSYLPSLNIFMIFQVERNMGNLEIINEASLDNSIFHPT